MFKCLPDYWWSGRIGFSAESGRAFFAGTNQVPAQEPPFSKRRLVVWMRSVRRSVAARSAGCITSGADDNVRYTFATVISTRFRHRTWHFTTIYYGWYTINNNVIITPRYRLYYCVNALYSVVQIDRFVEKKNCWTFHTVPKSFTVVERIIVRDRYLSNVLEIIILKLRFPIDSSVVLYCYTQENWFFKLILPKI